MGIHSKLKQTPDSGLRKDSLTMNLFFVQSKEYKRKTTEKMREHII